MATYVVASRISHFAFLARRHSPNDCELITTARWAVDRLGDRGAVLSIVPVTIGRRHVDLDDTYCTADLTSMATLKYTTARLTVAS